MSYPWCHTVKREHKECQYESYIHVQWNISTVTQIKTIAMSYKTSSAWSWSQSCIRVSTNKQTAAGTRSIACFKGLGANLGVKTYHGAKHYPECSSAIYWTTCHFTDTSCVSAHMKSLCRIIILMSAGVILFTHWKKIWTSISHYCKTSISLNLQ